MSAIGSDISSSSVTGSSPSAAEQADEAAVGTPASISEYETAQESADSTLLDLSGLSSSGVSSALDGEAPADMVAASALVGSLAGEISGGSISSTSVFSLLTADATLALTHE